jgi:hypothetical protein
MSDEMKAGKTGSRWKLSLDTWAVLVAFLAAILVRTGVFQARPLVNEPEWGGEIEHV